MKEWRTIDATCEHCHGTLEARPIPATWILAGSEPMEYRHADTGTVECFIRREARPYSNWGMRAKWLAAQEGGENE